MLFCFDALASSVIPALSIWLDLAGGEDYYTKVAEGGACKTATVQPLDFWEDHTPANKTEYLGTYSAFIYAERAVEIINSHASSAARESGEPLASPRPLFLYLAMQNVHWPLQVRHRCECECILLVVDIDIDI